MNAPDNPNPFDQAAWIAQARQLLDASARDLDAATASRLNRARQSALALKTRRRSQRWLLPAGLASACALLLAFAIWPQQHGKISAVSAATSAAAMGTMSDADATPADDTPEFYQDLEFYAWLDAQGKDGDG